MEEPRNQEHYEAKRQELRERKEKMFANMPEDQRAAMLEVDALSQKLSSLDMPHMILVDPHTEVKDKRVFWRFNSFFKSKHEDVYSPEATEEYMTSLKWIAHSMCGAFESIKLFCCFLFPEPVDDRIRLRIIETKDFSTLYNPDAEREEDNEEGED